MAGTVWSVRLARNDRRLGLTKMTRCGTALVMRGRDPRIQWAPSERGWPGRSPATTMH